MSKINLLPSRWRLPSTLRRSEVKIRLLSIVGLGIYLILVVGLFVWTGVIALRKNDIDSQIKNVSGELVNYRSLEASEELLAQKVAFAQNIANNQVDVGIGVSRIFSLMPASGITLQDLNADSLGKVGVGGFASSSGSLASLFSSLEESSQSNKNLFKSALAGFDLSSGGKFQFKIDLGLVPDQLKLVPNK